MIRLDTLDMLRGVADRRDLAEAIAWARSNLGALEMEWTRLNERG